MTCYSHPDLLNMVAQLDRALDMHEHWYNGIVRTFIARLPPAAADLLPDAHRRCALGQWYNSDEPRMLKDHPAFAALGDAHEQMHHMATLLLQRVNQNAAVSADEIDEFSTVRDRMKLQIQSWRQDLSDIAQNSDALTGARNRVTMLSDLREQHSLVQRGVQRCAIALFDLDHFKDVNDRHGHLAGDNVLACTIHHLDSLIRPYDRIYRYGGEEFLLCMPNTSLDDAAHLAERLRAAVESNRIAATTDVVLQITASFGVSALDAAKSVEESIDEVDKALYLAKSRGRNRVETVH